MQLWLHSVYGGPCIIIDIGTAMTFCVVDKDRTYRDLFRVGIAAEALFERTSKLPRIEIKKTIVQTDTVSSMQSGLYHGYNALIDGIIRKKIIDEVGFDEKRVQK